MYYNERHHKILVRLIRLDDEIHELLDDSEYEADLQKCEENIEPDKRAILRTSHKMVSHLSSSTANVTIKHFRRGCGNCDSDC